MVSLLGIHRASGRAGGLLALDWHHSSTESLAALSYKLHRQLAEEHGGEQRWGYRTLDTLSVSADLTTSQKSARKSPKETDARFAWLNKDKLRETSVLGTKETTAQVHPRLFTEGLGEEAKKLGVQFVEGTASSLTRKASTITIATEEGDEHTCSQLIVTTGPWTGRLLSQLGLAKSAGRAARIDGSRAHSVVLKTAKGRDLPAQALFTAIKENGGMSEPEIYVSSRLVPTLASLTLLGATEST